MKNIVLIIIVLITCNLFAQVKFERGYFIDNTNQKTECLIKNIDWKNNPLEFEYKLTENETPKIATLKDAKEFCVYNQSRFVRSVVQIDKSNERLNAFNYDKDPKFEQEVLFLKVIVEGKAVLYKYLNPPIIKYFYSVDGAPAQQLVYKKYMIKNDDGSENLAENNLYKKQLNSEVKCGNSTINMSNFRYVEKDLTNYFKEYNKCNNPEFVEKTIDKEKNFGVTGKLSVATMALNTTHNGISYLSANYENKLSLQFGAELEYTLPFNKRKWALFAEPTFVSYKAEKQLQNLTDVSGGILNTNVDYKAFEVPLGLRYYMFLNKTSKFHLSAAYTIDLPSSSSKLTMYRANESLYYEYDMDGKSNIFCAAFGYTFANRFSAELKYKFSKNPLRRYYYFDSELTNNISITLGYTFLRF